MAKPSGLPKTGGRQKGTLNKRTLLLSESIIALNFDVPSRLIEILDKLELEKQADVLLNLMPYLYPKLKQHEVSIQNAVTAVSVQSEETPNVEMPLEDEIRIYETLLMAKRMRLEKLSKSSNIQKPPSDL